MQGALASMTRSDTPSAGQTPAEVARGRPGRIGLNKPIHCCLDSDVRPGFPPALSLGRSEPHGISLDAHAPVGCCRHQGIRRTPRTNQSRSRLFTRAGRHQYAKHRRFRRLRRTPSSRQRPQSKIVCLGLRARSTSRFCLPAKCGMPLRATDPIAFHRPERSHNLSFSYPQKSAVLTSPERKSASGCSSRTRGELSLQNARKSHSQSLHSDRTSIAPGRACSARGSR